MKPLFQNRTVATFHQDNLKYNLRLVTKHFNYTSIFIIFFISKWCYENQKYLDLLLQDQQQPEWAGSDLVGYTAVVLQVKEVGSKLESRESL